MDTRKKILVGVLIALVVSSVVMLYRSTRQPLDVVKTTASSDDIVIKSKIDAVKVKIMKAIHTIDTGGALDALTQGKQFQELVTDGIVETTIPPYGRGNPFVPPSPVISEEAGEGAGQQEVAQ